MADVLTSALAKHLCNVNRHGEAPCPEHLRAAAAALRFLADAGALLPAGITLQGVEVDGERSWRLRGRGIDVLAPWQLIDPEETT